MDTLLVETPIAGDPEFEEPWDDIGPLAIVQELYSKDVLVEVVQCLLVL